jgi:enoyl-CoA hydratase
MLKQENYETILIEKRSNGVAQATLNRPKKLNAVDGRLHYELTTLWVDTGADPEVKVLLVTGAGRAFCAGGDFSADRKPGPGGPNATIREARQIVDNLLDCEKPIVALLCDVVVAGRKTTFADTHVRMGIGAGDGGQVIWPLLMGVNRAKYFLMTGEHLPAEEAYALGLVNFVVDEDQLLDKATAIAERLAAGPSLAISASKVPVNKYIKMVSNLVLPLSLNLEEATMRSADAAEAGAAFREKREPKFVGR